MRRKYLFLILVLALAFVSSYLRKDSFLAGFRGGAGTGTAGSGATGPGSAGFPHPVIRVVDGDTIIVIIGGRRERVRLIGIDAPESVRPGYPVEYCGREASRYAKDLLRGKSVRLEYDVEKRDRYGRLLAYVYTAGKREGERVFVNAEILRMGFATALNIPPNTKFAGRFYKFQKTAREEGSGVWGEDGCRARF